ncbi:MAG: hypothetical protein ACOY3P_26650 [Planctomycetota bacterium]
MAKRKQPLTADEQLAELERGAGGDDAAEAAEAAAQADPREALCGPRDAAAGDQTDSSLTSPIGDTAPVWARVELPLGPVPIEQVRASRYHITRHVEARLSMEQGIALRRLEVGLDQAGARLRSGKRVASHADAIRWLLERIEESA